LTAWAAFDVADVDSAYAWAAARLADAAALVAEQRATEAAL
jgi:hypothetical protein